MRTWLSFFFYDAFWIWIPIFLSPRLLSISRTSYFLPHSIIPISGKETEIEKEKERKKKRKKGENSFRRLKEITSFPGIIYRKYYLSNETFFATGTGISFAFSRIDRISVQNDKILPGNVCSVRSYCFRQFFNNNYASKLLNNGTGFLLFFKTPPFFFALEEIHDVCAARNP